MPPPTAAEEALVQPLADIAQRHGFGRAAVQSMWDAIRRGDGSMAQFSHPEFVGRVKQALASSRAPAEGLIMEITESVLISDIQNVTERLHELVQLGVRFSIDDFGTGFSSLAYLRQLPLHEIKIDRSFIAGLPEDVANVGIVRSILAVGSHLGLLVIAEGVETQEQADFLQAQGCRLQQGWLHGRPGSEAQFIETITAGAA